MLLNYLPSFVGNIKEIKTIMEINKPEIIDINQHTHKILKNMFIIEATESGVSRYEEIVDIVPKMTENIENRKSIILGIYNQVLPFTEESLIAMLDGLCGKCNYKMIIIYSTFELHIEIKPSGVQMKGEILKLLERVVPINMKLIVSVDYNKWEDFKTQNWKKISIKKWKDLKIKDLWGV